MTWYKDFREYRQQQIDAMTRHAERLGDLVDYVVVAPHHDGGLEGGANGPPVRVK